MKSLNKMTLAEMNAEIETLGKRANTRISALEKLEGEFLSDADASLFKAVKYAQPYNRNFASGRPRFSRAKAQTIQEARARISNVRKFLNIKTTTKTGIKSARERRRKLINEKYDLDLSQSDYNKLINIFNKIDPGIVSSDELVNVFGEVVERLQLIGHKVDTEAFIEFVTEYDLPAVKNKKGHVKASYIWTLADW